MREGNSLPICRVEEGSQSSQKQPRQSTQITQSRGKAGVGYFFASESSPNTSCVRGCGAEVCMWLGPSHRQAKDNEKNSGVDGSLTSCGDAQKESENKAFIQVFHPIQSVKSTNKVMLRYTHIRQDQASQRWRR